MVTDLLESDSHFMPGQTGPQLVSRAAGSYSLLPCYHDPGSSRPLFWEDLSPLSPAQGHSWDLCLKCLATFPLFAQRSFVQGALRTLWSTLCF